MTMTVGELFIALVLIALVLLVSNALRLWLPWLRRLVSPQLGDWRAALAAARPRCHRALHAHAVRR